MGNPTRLPIVVIKGKTYFMDRRLQEYREVNNPHNCIRFAEEAENTTKYAVFKIAGTLSVGFNGIDKIILVRESPSGLEQFPITGQELRKVVEMCWGKMEKVSYSEVRTRYWTCTKCGHDNEEEVDKLSISPPTCDECGTEFEWGDEEG